MFLLHLTALKINPPRHSAAEGRCCGHCTHQVAKYKNTTAAATTTNTFGFTLCTSSSRLAKKTRFDVRGRRGDGGARDALKCTHARSSSGPLKKTSLISFIQSGFYSIPDSSSSNDDDDDSSFFKSVFEGRRVPFHV